MQILLFLFFASLVGIAAMIGRKLFLLRSGQINTTEEFSFEIPDAQEIKHVAVKHTKKYGYVALVETLRAYLRFSNFLKQVSKEMIKETEEMLSKHFPSKEIEQKEKEASKFLQTVSEYKHKIQRIKHKIKEEEGIQ